MAKKNGNELVAQQLGASRQGVGRPPGASPAPVAYGRRLNHRARAIVHDALGRLIEGGDLVATRDKETGLTMLEMLYQQLRRDPLGALMRIDAATPSDEGEEAAKGLSSVTIDARALYLQAVIGAQKGPPLPEPKLLIEGSTGDGMVARQLVARATGDAW